MILKFKLEKLLRENNDHKLKDILYDMFDNNCDIIYRNVTSCTNIKESFTYKNDIIHITVSNNKLKFGINDKTFITDIEYIDSQTVSKYDLFYSYVRITTVISLSTLFLYFILKQ